MVRSQIKDLQRRPSTVIFTVLMSIALTLVMILSMFLLPFTRNNKPSGLMEAYAVTSAEKQAEVDAAMRRLDEFQTELNRINAEYNTAVAVHEDATRRMLEAQAREMTAQARIVKLQEQLSMLATQLYRKGPISFFEVVFGAKSFGDFITAFEMALRVNTYNAELIAESRVVRAEAEAARLEYAEQERVAIEKEAEAAELKQQADATYAEMWAEIVALQDQAAELLFQEQLEAEAARLRAEEEARRIEYWGASVDPYIAARVPILVHPCPGYRQVTSGFGWRWGEFHLGTDFGADWGTPIYAAAAGTVTFAGWNSSMGYYIIINHGNGVRTIYMHTSDYYVYAGAVVYQGQEIAAVGSTGNSTGPHLHFQLEVDGTAYDPEIFLYRR